MTKQELEAKRSDMLAGIYQTLAEISKLEAATGGVSDDEMVSSLRAISKQNFNALTTLDLQIATAA